MKRFIAFFSLASVLMLTSCEVLTDYSGVYSGDLYLEMTVGGQTTTTQVPMSWEVTREGGMYYLDGAELTGSGTSYSYTESDGGVTFTIDIDFTDANTMTLEYTYEVNLGVDLYEYRYYGTFTK